MNTESDLLAQRSQTANAGAGEFLEGLRTPEDQTLPAPETYGGELVRAVAGATGLEVLYVGPDGEPMSARDEVGNSVDPQRAYRRLGLDDGIMERASTSPGGQGRLILRDGPRYIAVFPLLDADGRARGVMVYTAPREGLDQTLAYLRYGILGAILASMLLAGLGSLLLTRQITRPLSETRDAAIRVASGDYKTSVPVTSNDELGEMARAFNYMAEEIEHYVGEIQEQKSRLEAVLEASPEAVVAADPDGRVTMVNPAAAGMLGILATDYGRRLDEIGVPGEVSWCLKEAAATGVCVREFESGEKTYWAYAARMGSNVDESENGTESGAILAVRDITEHRSLERAKTAFVSDFSHELRTPLTTIQSAVGLLERARERLDPLEHRALELADQELKRIRGMIEELLTLAQMDSWRYSLELGPADLGAVIRNSVEALETKAERFGIEVRFEDGAEHPCVCDAQKLYQVFLNLLDNAIKYSDSGDRVDIFVEEKDSFVWVMVRDTGVGIPDEDLDQLFERFYRVDKDRSRATGGSGLGLAITKEIVELHGGSVSVES
ncbi:MAG: ATP-binding protein, partial [Rubrobacteraceae bacterium]